MEWSQYAVAVKGLLEWDGMPLPFVTHKRQLDYSLDVRSANARYIDEKNEYRVRGKA
jgi:hypothetical protein